MLINTGFLIKVCFQVNLVTSAMFMTGLVGNPLIASLAGGVGVEITWMTWAVAAIIPGLINLLIIPIVIFTIYPPEVKYAPEAQKEARRKQQKTEKMGR